jgi:hypothetical protein
MIVRTYYEPNSVLIIERKYEMIIKIKSGIDFDDLEIYYQCQHLVDEHSSRPDYQVNICKLLVL